MAELLNKLDLEGRTIRLAGWQAKNFSPWYGCPTFVGDQTRFKFTGTANTLLEVVTLTESVTGAVYFNAQGYQAY